MRKSALMLACVLALCSSTIAAGQTIQGPFLLTKDYATEHAEELGRIKATFEYKTPFSLNAMGRYRFLTVLDYADNTHHYIGSNTPPSLVGGQFLEVRGPAELYSVSPSDHEWLSSEDYAEVTHVDATMDFQTTVRVGIHAGRMVAVTSMLADAKTLPISQARTYEPAGFNFGDVKRSPELVHQPVSTAGFTRTRGKLGWDPALHLDVGLQGWLQGPIFIPGGTLLRKNGGLGLNVVGLSTTLASAKDGQFRFARLGLGLGLSPNHGTKRGWLPALTVQFTPVSIAFGNKASWAREKDAKRTRIDRLRRYTYLDIGVNMFISHDRPRWGPFLQTSVCVAGCN